MARSGDGRGAFHGLPLVPMGPILVVVTALVAAVAIALLGVGQLQVTSDAAAAERAEVLAATLGARLRATPQEGRGLGSPKCFEDVKLFVARPRELTSSVLCAFREAP